MSFQPTQKGYDTNATRRPLPGRENGRISFGDSHRLLWVYDVRSDFAMTGATAQSFRTRSFFARNFSQPSFTIACQSPNQANYAETVEFIRDAQVRLRTMRIEIWPGMKHLKPINGRLNRRLRGRHSRMMADGYVRVATRAHERHIYAPDWTFDFIVARMILPKEWADDPVKIRRLVSWNDIIEKKKPGFVEDPDQPVKLDEPDIPDFDSAGYYQPGGTGMGTVGR